MATVDTSATGYCTAAQFLETFDQRTIARLVSNTGVEVSVGSLATNAVLARALLAVSGRVEAACLAGQRYTPADLAALTGASAAYLAELVATLAMGRLILFRPGLDIELPPSYQEALADLESLRHGELIFAFTEVENAGVMDFQTVTPTDVQTRNDAVSQLKDYFGARAADEPPR